MVLEKHFDGLLTKLIQQKLIRMFIFNFQLY